MGSSLSAEVQDTGMDRVEGVEGALYNKYRPRRFKDVLGQDQNMAGLSKAAKENNPSQAYLFSGSRGTGKTTTARILAAGLNCTDKDRQDGEPCGKCESCRTTFHGTSIGVCTELNATDHRGIDAMREFLSSINTGVSARRKIYIIDEVHMLTNDASSLLLKYLEEPPTPHIVFVLATTDPNKLLPTILSRVTHLKFSLLSDDTLTKLLSNINVKEKLKLSEAQIRQAMRAGRGSARDAVTALDSISQGYQISDTEVVDKIIDGVLDNDLAVVLTVIANGASSGSIDYTESLERLLSFWRDSLLMQMNPSMLPESDKQYTEMVSRGAKMDATKLIRNIETVSASTEVLRTSNNRIVLEGCIARLLMPELNTDNTEVLRELRDVREEVKNLSKKMSFLSAPRKGEQEVWSETAQNEQVDNWPDASQTEQKTETSTSPRRRRRRAAQPEPEPEQQNADEVVESQDDTSPRRRRRSAPERSEDTEQAAPRRRRRRGDVDEDNQIDGPDEQERQEPSQDEGSEQLPEEVEAQWNEFMDSGAVSGRSRGNLEAATLSMRGSALVVATEGRLTSKTQQAISDHFGECEFEVLD